MGDNCVFCGNQQLDSKTTRYIYQKHQQLLIVEKVPCLECAFCGEQYFDVVVVQKIEDDYNAIASCQKQPARFVQVGIEDFSTLAP
ncbi:MAG: type II toxin-antitoxin system MqsA family antitoxin [Methylovulum sp.]|uniref:type II toxin-antitoxin system MqsA family antitoxin n=1 Tax=Methylovulum sp. TaxID=1916980 RepID=UPI002612A3A7|nr:type II toxin-antitoxin system MqsA family antitoxin [Methylovulum sp.]MDD2723601.1 type II toxin-antitoxin system MqsA family antitoxin [Methylovulum sp.]MDD5125497.1 type II toxin-antitoxin system MqsA family antitoxin [Methylovulum sp.]